MTALSLVINQSSFVGETRDPEQFELFIMPHKKRQIIAELTVGHLV